MYKTLTTIDLEGKRFYQISDEILYPSITTVLGGTMSEDKKQGLENWRNWLGKDKAKEVSTEAARRGTSVHLLIEKFLAGEDPNSVPHVEQKDRAMFNSLKLNLRKVGKIHGQEVALYSDLLQVAGRCDLIAEYDGVDSIVDYKTSTNPKDSSKIEDYWLQATFYALAHNEMFGTEISQLVILMAVEKGLPVAYKKQISVELVDKLCERIEKFYSELK